MRPTGEQLISKKEALERIDSAWTPQRVIEIADLTKALGRVLAVDQVASWDLPVVRASHMDGIAVHAERFANADPDTSGWKLGKDFIRADTGDDFDDAYDAVIPIEQVTLLPDGGVKIAPGAEVHPGTNVKPKGSDLKKGTVLARKGKVLTERDLALLAMGGEGAVPVMKRPVVAFVPTGSELVPAGSALQRGQNFDSNSCMAAAMLKKMGAEPLLHPIVMDDPDKLETALDEVLPKADIVLINAGTSKGGEDYCAGLLAKRGTVLFHGVAAVPGRPMSAAVIDGKLVFNLSGPAFAFYYSMDWAVRYEICRALETPVPKKQTVRAVLEEDFGTPPHLSLMLGFRVRALEKEENGVRFAARPIQIRGPKAEGTSAALSADAYYVSTPGEPPHKKGEVVELELPL